MLRYTGKTVYLRIYLLCTYVFSHNIYYHIQGRITEKCAWRNWFYMRTSPKLHTLDIPLSVHILKIHQRPPNKILNNNMKSVSE